MLGWVVDEKQIAPYVPVWDKVRRDSTFERKEFVWDARNNEVVACFLRSSNLSASRAKTGFEIGKAKSVRVRISGLIK